MTPDVVWVYPSAKVKTAIIMMKGHKIGALPVVYDHGAVRGLLDYQSLLGEDPDSTVMDVMTPTFTTILPETTVYEAAEIMARTGESHLLVVEEGGLVGVVSHGDLLPELGKSFDPLTNLPWSDTLRSWSVNALKRAMEISIILIDLNKFGAFNKQYGHVVGDDVLKAVAETLKSNVDPDLDFLCRYGGDEFAISSIRLADDSIALGERLVEEISKIEIPDLPDGVSATFGMSGGRRTKEREDIHYAATLDDLINRASRNCTANKPHKPEETPASVAAPTEETTAEFEPAPLIGRSTSTGRNRLKISKLVVSSLGPETGIEVELGRGGQIFAHSVTGYTVAGRNALRLAAEAAAGAVSKSLETGYGVVVDQVFVFEPAPDQQVISVTAVFVTPQHNITHVGSAIVRRGDIYKAAVSALLSAVNRLVETAPQSAQRKPVEEPVEETPAQAEQA